MYIFYQIGAFLNLFCVLYDFILQKKKITGGLGELLLMSQTSTCFILVLIYGIMKLLVKLYTVSKFFFSQNKNNLSLSLQLSKALAPNIIKSTFFFNSMSATLCFLIWMHQIFKRWDVCILQVRMYLLVWKY